MLGRTLRVVLGSVALMGGAFIASAQEKPPTPGNDQDLQSVRYKAEEGLPGDNAGEKRRDYVVLEAALNDLTSPRNPEYNFHIENVGLGREVVIDDETNSGDLSSFSLGSESHIVSPFQYFLQLPKKRGAGHPGDWRREGGGAE